MKDIIIASFAAALFLWLPNRVGETTINHNSLGAVKIFKNPSVESENVIILLSGSRGWTSSENDLAYQIAQEKSLVIGVDASKIQSSKCKLNSGGELQTLANELATLATAMEQTLHFKNYIKPSLIAMKDSGERALEISFESKPESFYSINTVGGCFNLSSHASCGHAAKLNVPVQIFYDERVNCPAFQSEFKSNEHNVKIKKVSDLNSNPFNLKSWSSEMKAPWNTNLPQSRSIASQEPQSKYLDDLPLITLDPLEDTKDSFVIIYSGDGGWSDFTQDLAAEYLKHGYPVVGVNSLFYFWKPKTPEVGASDLTKIVELYQKKFGRKKFILVGFSFGADTIPFFVNRLDKKITTELSDIVFLAQSQNAQFKIEVSDWFNDEDTGDPILPELIKLSGPKIKCLSAERDRKSACSNLPKSDINSTMTLKGGHHFDNDMSQFNKILW